MLRRAESSWIVRLADWWGRVLFFKLVASLLVGALVIGFISLIWRFSTVSQVALLVAVTLLVLGLLTYGWRRWAERVTGWSASHFQFLAPNNVGLQVVMTITGPEGAALLNLECIVVGPRGIIARAPKHGHVFHDRSTPQSDGRWLFPSEFDFQELHDPLPRGVYRATWSGVVPDDLLGGQHALLARDYLLVWPHGVFRGKVRD